MYKQHLTVLLWPFNSSLHRNFFFTKTANVEKTIQQQWLFIESSILKNLQGQNNEREEVMSFLLLKFESLAKSEETKSEKEQLFLRIFEGLQNESLIAGKFQTPH